MGARKVEVTVALGPFEADLVRELLASYGIASEVSGVVSASAVATASSTSSGAGQLAVLVDESEAARAEDILAGHRRSGLALVSVTNSTDDEPDDARRSARGEFELVRQVEIAVVRGPFEGALIRGLLESYGIAAELSSALSHSVLPCVFDEAGRVGVLVKEDDAPAAEELLARHRRSGLSLVPAFSTDGVEDTDQGDDDEPGHEEDTPTRRDE